MKLRELLATIDRNRDLFATQEEFVAWIAKYGVSRVTALRLWNIAAEQIGGVSPVAAALQEHLRCP